MEFLCLRRRIGRFVSKSKSPKRQRKFCPKLIFYPATFSSTHTQGVELIFSRRGRNAIKVQVMMLQ